jgi:hypothetical protein
MAVRLSLGELVGAGTRAVGKYTGTLLAVFLAQTVIAMACMFAVWLALAQAYAHVPLWDEAVDGDLVSLIYCLRYGEPTFSAIVGVAIGALLLWTVISWFLVGGIHGVLAQRPEGRADTARCFGAAGASTFLAYARLALCSIPAWIAVSSLFAWGMATFASQEKLLHILTLPQLAGTLTLAVLPAALVLHIAWTITDYARVELSLRYETHEPSVVMTYLRSAGFVLKRPLTLVHGGLGWFAFAVITIGYAYLALGHPMYGAEGAITLFVIRQGVALARAAIRFGVLSGQLELGKLRPLPPRRIEAKAEPKKP